jgi:aryl-alcohol dehydrogenase-like predicted oxidoreductase
MVPSATLRDRWEQAKLDDLLDGANRIEFTLRFTLSHPGLHTTIVGTSKLEHLQQNIAAAKKGPLPPAIVEKAKRRLAEVGAVSEAQFA